MKNKFLNYKFYLILISALILSCAYSPARNILVTIPNTEIKFITSKENNVKYKLFVSLPHDYHSNTESYPVLYLLDPDEEFSVAENIGRSLANIQTITPLIVVGIGYEDQDPSQMDTDLFLKKTAINRTRDYIPYQLTTGIIDFEIGEIDYKDLAQYSGGSEKFKNFIEKELIPYIDRSYRTTKEHALTGHSLGGLFAIWMMLNYPTVFKKYIILSPSIWVQKNEILQECSKLNTSIELKAYFAVGSLENDPYHNMASDLKLIFFGLPKSDHFESKIGVVEGENHVSMVPEALIKGFKFLFGK